MSGGADSRASERGDDRVGGTPTAAGGRERRRPPAGREDVAGVFGRASPIVGMVHLLPLPGSPGWQGSMDRVRRRARADAEALLEGGVDGLLVENYGDVPFPGGSVSPETVAAMALALDDVREVAADRPVGVNVLRNDARAAVGLAAVAGASFLRVNVHTGTMFTDQGLIQGRADETVRALATLAPRALLVADVLVKHATPPSGVDPGTAAQDLRHRGLADVLVVSGARTGAPVDPARVQAVKEAVPDAPVWIGSGLTPRSAAEIWRAADGAIVGSSFHREGRIGAGVDVERVRDLVAAVRG